MGIVRSIQKGEAPASKFSKDAQDAAKKMKKSSVKKYAKTKHDDLPTKKESTSAYKKSLEKIAKDRQLKMLSKKDKETLLKIAKMMKEGVQRDRNNLALQIIDLNNMLGQARLSKNPKAKKYIKMIQKDLKDAKKKLSKLKEERDYKAEYKKFQSSTKAKKYRAELNKYNRQKGTYGNGDGKDASHKGGKIVGFEKESVNRGRAEKSRLKKEANMPDFNPMIDKALDEVIEEYTMARKNVIDKIATLAKANKYGTVDGTQMNGKTAKQIIAIYNHPKMKRFKKAMDDYTVDQFVDLTIKLPKVLGIKEELMNENPAAIAAAQRMVVQNKMGKKVSVMTAKNASYKEKDSGAHNKAKSIWDRIKARFSKKEGVNEAESKIKDFRMIVKRNKAKRVDNMKIDVPTAKAIIKKYKSLGKHQKQKFITQKLKNVVKSVNESINEAGMELKKLEDAIKFFKKKIEKQGRVTNARDEEHLERLMKVYNDMGGRKIKENNELFEWLQEACWKGYEKKGMKTMFGKRYPNCVKKTKKKEGMNENSAEKEKIFKYLVKKGDTPTDARYELNRSYDFVKKRYKGASVAKKAQIISDLSKYESVNEGLDKRQAAELLKQLGGNKFIAMTGAKNFGIGKDGLSFKIGKNAKAVNYVVIQLNGKDLYDMKFQKGTRVLKKANDVYADQLQKMFTKHTGMYTRL